MISDPLEKTLHAVFVAACQRRQSEITVENLLMGLLDDADAKRVLLACGADLSGVADKLSEIIDAYPKVEGQDKVDPEPTLAFQRVIQRAIMHVQSLGTRSKEVRGDNCVVALFGEKDSEAVAILRNYGVTRLDAVNFIAHGIEKVSDAYSSEKRFVRLAASADAAVAATVSGVATSIAALRLFVSYAHTDAACLARLLVHLKPMERQGLIDCWSDNKIRVGSKWKDEIEANLGRSAVAVLLVSADFLASDFIVNNELPPLLVRAEAQGLRVIPLILKPCGFHRDKILGSFQAVNDPRSPLLGLSDIGQEALYDKVADEIHREIELRIRSR